MYLLPYIVSAVDATTGERLFQHERQISVYPERGAADGGYILNVGQTLHLKPGILLQENP